MGPAGVPLLPPMKNCSLIVAVLAVFLPFVEGAEGKPNVVIFYLDDMAYGDPGCYGGKLAPTPHMDAIAAKGVRFTDGYVSACVCNPSRVGLMTGRYQARTGNDANGGKRPGTEFLLSETTMAQRLKAEGYATGLVGKWHLGTGPEYLPVARGFDFSIGSAGNLGEAGFFKGAELLEDLPGAPITSPEYAREACDFIFRSKDQPFFLYLAFNAVHNPNVASEPVLARFSHLAKRELNYAASLAEADDSIGRVMKTLRELGLEENTLVFCISDNGGSSPNANSDGLCGTKWFVWEGGIRVTWLAQWPARIPAGRVLAEPVIQLDVLPTALAAAGAEVKPEWQLDGVNLLPLLEGKAETLGRDALYWRFGVQWAIREGDWKLVKASKDMAPMLVNLASDRGEQTDLSAANPDKAKQLQAKWDAWNASMMPPRWEDKRWNGDPERKAAKKGKNAKTKGK